ncbi:uncharacterized protein L201_003933 [Kwoniella dendrophila CBS 6074]|uniref:DUF6534 domain-containing protein n=1 Tax=Kwoniella dendrophila CBS 6074 TaxID=1295534 RepID=A0AAX4JWU1_9TREE
MRHRTGFTPEQLNGLAKLGIEKHRGLYLGPFILGYAFDSMLLGCICQQLIWNMIWCPKDRLFNRIILFSTVILSFITTIFNDAFIFHDFASGFGNWYRIVELDYIMWFPVLDTATVTLVQIFYLERAYQLWGRAKWVPLVVSPFILAACGGAVGATIRGSQLPDAYDLKETYPAFYTWIGATLITDLLITSIIFWKLIKSRTGWSETDHMINKLITISVETQLPSLMVAIGFMVSYGVKPGAAMNVFFELFHPKVHVVGLLTVLNSRNKMRNQLKTPSSKENTYNVKGVKAAGFDNHEAVMQLEDGSIVPNLTSNIELTSDLSSSCTPSPPLELTPEPTNHLLSVPMLKDQSGFTTDSKDSL